MQALMQDFPLTLHLVVRRCLQIGATAEVVSVSPSGTDRRTWADVGRRSLLVGAMLERLGVAPGGRVGTFAWNSHRHVELFLGVPSSGRVVHPSNVRLGVEQILELMAHAGDEVLFVDASLTADLAGVRGRLPVGECVVMDDGGPIDPAFADCPLYERLLADIAPGSALTNVGENDAAWLCYTSGTTGMPKGVVASHRSAVLHSMSSMTVDSHAISADDVVLPATPMFHANAWGLPYTCAMAGATLVLPGRETTPGALARLINEHAVTVVAGVPTVLGRLVESLHSGVGLPSLQRVLCGGAAPPPVLLAALAAGGIEVVVGWGMTEMSPSGTSRHLAPGEALPAPASSSTAVGRPTPGVELRLVGGSGEELAWDGVAVGELEARGPWVIRAYLDPDDDSNERRFHDGWLRTGDLARIRPEGDVELVDRAKDVIKSGGEWVSSLELERLIGTHPNVNQVAVVACSDERWGERPVAVIVAAGAVGPSREEIAAFLDGRVPRWWIPDHCVVVAEIPTTATGKHDKQRLRRDVAAMALVNEGER